MKHIDTFRAHATMQKLIESEAPAPIIRAMAQAGDDAQASAFERYAANVLREAGALQLTAPGAPPLRMRHSENARFVRLVSPGSISGPQNAAVIALEDALNRLLGITSALAEGVGARVPVDSVSARMRRKEQFARHGIEYPLWSDTERGANVVLPPLLPGQQETEAYFNEIDWRSLDVVANNAHAFFQAAILTNMNQVIFGFKAPHCSEWDVRTRLASILEGLGAPLRLAYRYDFDTSRGLAAIHFNVPSARSFPTVAHGEPAAARGEAESPVDAARTVYALRLSALLGAACFGAGRIIDHALVVGKDDAGRVISSCAFERTAFVYESLPAIDAGELSQPSLRFDPERTARTLSATNAEYALGAPRVLAPGVILGMRPDPEADTRMLPDDLQRLFHARRVCDICTTGYLGGAAHVIDEAKADSANAPAAAIAQLEGISERLEAEIAPPDDQPDARPLYCGHALSRVAVALLDDELNVSNEAEAYLLAEAGAQPPKLPDVYYYRAPDALFHAHVGLADLYRKLGDARGAEVQADRCIALGPTTALGYALKADALAGRGRFSEAANVIVGGLRTAVSESDQTLLLHDLALLLWRMGRQHDASALHIHTASRKGVHARKSAEFVRAFADGVDVQTFIRLNASEAAQVVASLGIPIVPDRTRHALVSRAALGLADANAPRAAAPYAALLAECFPTNRAVKTACDSVRFGLAQR